LAAKLGFQDADLKTPEHDEIMLWLDAQLREEEFCQRLARHPPEFDAEWLAAEEREAEQWTVDFREELLDAIADARVSSATQLEQVKELCLELESWTPPPRPEVPVARVAKVTWEQPIGDPRWIAGFIDLHAVLSPVLEEVFLSGCKGQFGTTHDREYRVSVPAWGTWAYSAEFAFEVKTTLPSLGDLIRQIRFYQEKWGRPQPPRFYVVSGETKFVSPLQSQGIGFIEYPSGEITHPGR
jgi:hypothetical protein